MLPLSKERCGRRLITDFYLFSSGDKFAESNVARHIQIIMQIVAVVPSCVYAMRPTRVIKIQLKSCENNKH